MNWQLLLGKADVKVAKFMLEAWGRALADVDLWMQTDLVNAMINGGFGIEGIAQTPFYQFVSSPDGLSQLGIEEAEVKKLLVGYRRSFKSNASKYSLFFSFGNHETLKSNTRHPATGTGKLTVDSWLDWVFDKEIVTDAGFVPRELIPLSLRGHIRLGAPLGGLMLPKGGDSKGKWSFPKSLQDFDSKWFKKNSNKIKIAIRQQVKTAYGKRLNG